MAHSPSESERTEAVGKVTGEDPIWAKKTAQRRAGLTKSILWKHCPDASLRLFDFSNDFPDPRLDGVQEAGEAVLWAVQTEVRERQSPLEFAVASELAISRLWAIYALLRCTGSHAHAKLYEMEITNGEPLTICVGTGPFFPPVAGFRKLQAVTTLWGEVSIPGGIGCHSIMRESTRLGGVMWRYWCDDCAPNKGKKARAQARRHKRFVDEIRISRIRP